VKLIKFVATCLLLTPTFAGATVITHAFSVSLDFVFDPTTLLDSVLGVSLTPYSSVMGSLSVSSDVTPTGSDTIDGVNTNYFIPSSEASFGVQVGGNSLSGTDDQTAIFINGDDASDPDNWGFTQLLSTPTGPDQRSLFLLFALSDTSQTRLSDDTFFINQSMDGWDTAFWGIGELVGDPFSSTRVVERFIAGGVLSVDDVRVSVPEPSTFGLLLTGFLGVALLKRRRGHSAS